MHVRASIGSHPDHASDAGTAQDLMDGIAAADRRIRELQAAADAKAAAERAQETPVAVPPPSTIGSAKVGHTRSTREHATRAQLDRFLTHRLHAHAWRTMQDLMDGIAMADRRIRELQAAAAAKEAAEKAELARAAAASAPAPNATTAKGSAKVRPCACERTCRIDSIDRMLILGLCVCGFRTCWTGLRRLIVGSASWRRRRRQQQRRPATPKRLIKRHGLSRRSLAPRSRTLHVDPFRFLLGPDPLRIVFF